MKRLFAILLAACMVLPCCPAFCGETENSAAASASSGASVLPCTDEALSSGTFILTLSEGSPAPEINLPDVTVDYTDDSFMVVNITASDNAHLENMVSALSALDGVACVEPDSQISLMTDDYFYDSQYWFDNNGFYVKHSNSGSATVHSVPDIDIDAPEGWELYKENGSGIRRAVVAVIDTGIDSVHPDLADSMWVNPGEIPGNGIDDDGNGYIDDIYGWDFYNNDSSVCHYEYSELHMAELASPHDNDNHGTHCAGIIAAVRDNSIGIAGVASAGDVRLMSLKVHGGSDRSGSVSDAIKAIRYADMMGADVCNISWGSYTYSGSLYTAIQRSRMLFVCAAGNDGTDNDSRPLYPASYDLDNIISVTFTDGNGNLCYNANYGTTTVDVAVPANEIFSTVVGTYGLMGGSSMAAPQVSGMAALLFTLNNGMYASNVRDILLGSVKPLDSCNTLMQSPGIVSLSLAMQNSGMIVRDAEAPLLSVRLEYEGGELVLHFTPSDDISGVNSLRYFTGRRTDSYFKHGTAGTAVSDNRLALSKGGQYTFYANDYAGNSMVKTLRIPDDIIAPVITDTAVSVNNKRTKITVSATISERQSGLRSVKYLKGCHDASDFKSSSIEAIEPDEDGRIKFTVTEEGTYTIYACDNRGNATVSYAMAYIRPATAISLKRSRKTLSEGSTWTLGAELTPERSTDKITYSSSDESIATVSSRGKVTAVSSGTCVITAVTSGGKSAECTIKVKPASEED